jgi:Bacteriophage HK97-gp10, putative tail-component
MKFYASVEGLASLQAGFAGIADETALADALAASAEEIRGAARANLQNGKPPESRRGDLADSLAIVPAADGMSVSVGTALPQGWYLEFGTRARPATPWLEPALDDARPGILARIWESLLASAPPRR